MRARLGGGEFVPQRVKLFVALRTRGLGRGPRLRGLRFRGLERRRRRRDASASSP